MPFCFKALLPHYNFPLDGIENKENVYQWEKIKYWKPIPSHALFLWK